MVLAFVHSCTNRRLDRTHCCGVWTFFHSKFWLTNISVHSRSISSCLDCDLVRTKLHCIRTPPIGLSVCRAYVKYLAMIVKEHVIFTWFGNLPMSTGLCPDARISTDLIKGLQLVICGKRFPLCPQSFLKPNHS